MLKGSRESLEFSSTTFTGVLQEQIKKTHTDAVPLVTGLSNSAQAFVLASVALKSKIFAVIPVDSALDEFTADVRFFYGALAGLSGETLEQLVVPFPSLETDPYRAIEPHFKVTSDRARTLTLMNSGSARVVIAPVRAISSRLSAPGRLKLAVTELHVAADFALTDLMDILADGGFSPSDPVDQHGEFCVRGGVLDFFPAGEDYPVRVEFLGDTIESIRQFDPESQRSVKSLTNVLVMPTRTVFEDGEVSERRDSSIFNRESSVFDYIDDRSTLIYVSESSECFERLEKQHNQIEKSYQLALNQGRTPDAPNSLFLSLKDVDSYLRTAMRFERLGYEGEHNLREIICQPVLSFHGRVSDWLKEIKDGRERSEIQIFVASSIGTRQRIREFVEEAGIECSDGDSTDEVSEGTQKKFLLTTGQLSKGFRFSETGLSIYTESDLFDQEIRTSPRVASRSFLSDLRDLKVGDYVVHVDHGIGRFVGLKQMAVASTAHELMEVRYAEADKLFVPVQQLELIQKYTGSSQPTLDRLGSTSWEKTKSRVRSSVRDMAQELLRLYASRRTVNGFCFSPDTHWQSEFEAAFTHDLTADQKTAVTDIKKDMESSASMDRLLCGDVGYGKTEVALRAAFKAIMDSKQVALLAPTTVLAFQHYKTIVERFAAFPVRVEMVSRLRSRSAQKKILADLATGKIDIIVGTHRLLSKDIKFHDLGLLVVDEEQRFGVGHKEKIKQIQQNLDVLTLTATPIPRTLNMSLMGIRDMSVIETPPKDRLSIQTNVVKFDKEVIERAIRMELDRQGQIYFVHNRIDSIYAMCDLVKRLVPGLRLAVAHGQSTEIELERVMVGFINHEYDLLLSTTIIENGLDIPNVNTIIINHAERYGLSQLYQLRGRVGRSDRRAYAYFLVPAEDQLSQVANQRLAAMKEFSTLGSGFRVAALDLEIRGAGNLLGAQQSGHIEAIGFDMYVKLLEETVQELKGESVSDVKKSTVNLGVDLRIDENYIPDTTQRLSVYRRIADAPDVEILETIIEELSDRYGPLPFSVVQLVEYGKIRVRSSRLGIESIDRERDILVVRFGDNSAVKPERLIAFVQSCAAVTLSPPAVLRVNLKALANKSVGVSKSIPESEKSSWWIEPKRKKSKKELDHTATEILFGQVTDFLDDLGAL